MKTHSPGKKILSFVCAFAILIAQIPAIQLFASATSSTLSNEPEYSTYFSLANMEGSTAASANASSGVTANRWYCTDPNQFGMIMSGWGINQFWGHIGVSKNAADTIALTSSGSIPAGLTYLIATTAPNSGAPKTGTQPLKVPVDSKLDFSISSDQPYKIVITYGTKPLSECSTATDGGDNSTVDGDNYGYLQILKDGAVDNKKATGHWDDSGFYVVSNLDTNTLIPAGHHSYSVDLSDKLAAHATGATHAYIYAISIVTTKPNSLNMVIDQFDLKGPTPVTSATINGTAGTIDGSSISFVLPHGTDLTAMAPELGLATGAVLETTGAQNFSNGSVPYTVQYDGLTYKYNVKVSTEAEFFSVDDFTADKGTHSDPGPNLSGGNKWYCTENDFFKALSYGWGIYTKWDYLSVAKTSNGLTLSNNGSEDSKVGLTYLFGTSKHPNGGEYIVGNPLKVPVDTTLDLAVNSSIPFKFVVSYGAIHPTTGAITYGFLEIGKKDGSYAVINSNAGAYNAEQNQWPADRTANLIPAGEHSVSLPLNAIANGVEGCTNVNIYGISVVVYEHDPHYGYELNISKFSLKSVSPVTSASACEKDGTIVGNSINIAVPYETDLSAITPNLGLVSGATVVSPAGAQNFTSGPVEYTIGLNGVNYKYTVAISKLPAATDCDITAAKIAGYNATINGTNITLELPINKDLAALEPVFTYPSNATIDKSGPQDFSSPVVYTVTAQDGRTQKQYTVSVTHEGVSYLDFSGITPNAGSRPSDVATTNTWFCGGVDPIKYPFHSWGLSGMWGHISVAKDTDGVITIANNGSDVNPDVIRYSFGAESYSASVPPPAIAIQGKYLYIDVTSETEFKLVIPFTATNSENNAKKYGFVTIITDANGQLAMDVSSQYDASPSDSVCQGYYSKSTGMIPAGSYKGLLPLSDLRSFTDNCSEINLYAFDVVGPTGKALNISLDFNAPYPYDHDAAEIKSFTVNGYIGTITGDQIAVSVPYGTDLANLTSEIKLPVGATISPANAKNFTSPVALTVTAPDGKTTKTYTVTVTLKASTECDVLSMKVNGYTATIDGTSISVKLPLGTDLSKLTPSFAISEHATITPAGEQNFSSGSVTYTVTAQDGETAKQYTVSVSHEALSIQDFTGITGNSGSRPDDKVTANTWFCGGVDATKNPSQAWGMDGMWGHISVSKNADGIITLTNNGNDVNPNVIRYSFGPESSTTATAPLTNVMGKYLYVNVTSETDFKFVLPFAAVNSVTSEKTYSFATITLDANGTMVAKLSTLGDTSQAAPCYSKDTDMIPAGSYTGLIPLSLLTTLADNCAQVQIFAFDVIGPNGKALDINIDFNAPANLSATACDILTFTVNGVEATIDGTNITVELPHGTDLTNLTTGYTLSTLATPTPADAKDFSNPVELTVTALDGATTKVYTVTVTTAAAPSEECDILSATINGVAGTIDGTNITVKLPVGTDFSKLEPIFTISDNATISPIGEQNFNEPVVYTVTAQNGIAKKEYTVSVTFEDVTFIEPGNITADSGSRNGGVINHNSWYCTDHNGTIDPSKAWGMDGMWGHIEITKAEDGSIVIHNNGTDVNPALIRYSFGTEESGTAPGKTTISGKYLYINTKSATKFKLVIPYAAVNAVTSEKTYAFAVITENAEGEYVVKTSVLAGDGQPAPAYSKETDMMRAGSHEGMISLAALGNVTENCSEIYIFAWDVVAEDGKALDLSFNFKAPSEFVSTDCDIVDFKANGIAGTIKDTDITVTVPYNTDLNNIITQITASVGATVSPENVKDFSSPVKLTVTAPDGKTTKVYTVTIKVARSSYADIGTVSSNNGVDIEDGKIITGAWYSGNVDAVKYPFAGWGLSPMWDHIALSEKEGTVFIINNGNDINPSVIRYVFGTDNRSDAPVKTVSTGDLLHIEAKSNKDFKLVVTFAAVDPVTGVKKYGLMEIYPDANGNLVTKVTDADMTGNNGHVAAYDKTTHLFKANVAYEADVLLSGLTHGIDGCSEAYIYSIDVVTTADKAFTMMLNFTPDRSVPVTSDNFHVYTLMTISLMAVCCLAVLVIYHKKSIAK